MWNARRFSLFVFVMVVLSSCAGSPSRMTSLSRVASIEPPSEAAQEYRDSEPDPEDLTGVVVTGSRISSPRRYKVRELIVHYATDRQITARSEISPGQFDVTFGSKRDTAALHYGTAVVTIPASIHVAGNVERPQWWKLQFTSDPERHFTLRVARSLDPDQWVSLLRTEFRDNRRRLLLFVHGYNVSFEEAVLRTAQIAWDTRFPGPALLYSWASAGKVAGYPADEATAELAVTNLTRLLRQVLESSQASEVYLIAHSMGNRILTRALIDVVETNAAARERIREVVLAAPDIDADVFRTQIAPRLPGVAKNVTLYASGTDEALRASRKFHGGYPRVGDTNSGIRTFADIETIDASNEGSDFLGHSYIANSPRVLVDLRNLFLLNIPPADRGLVTVQDGAAVFWRFPTH